MDVHADDILIQFLDDHPELEEHINSLVGKKISWALFYLFNESIDLAKRDWLDPGWWERLKEQIEADINAREQAEALEALDGLDLALLAGAVDSVTAEEDGEAVI